MSSAQDEIPIQNAASDTSKEARISSMIGIIGHDQALNMLLEDESYFLVEEQIILTPFGHAFLINCKFNDRQFVFVPRYRRDPATLKRTRPKAMIYALASVGIRTVMSVNGVGTLNESIAVGDFAVPNDFIDLAFAEDRSYLMQRPAGVFVRMNPPFCPALSNSVSAALEEANARTQYYLRTPPGRQPWRQAVPHNQMAHHISRSNPPHCGTY